MWRYVYKEIIIQGSVVATYSKHDRGQKCQQRYYISGKRNRLAQRRKCELIPNKKAERILVWKKKFDCNIYCGTFNYDFAIRQAHWSRGLYWSVGFD